mgnify:CR=1 FL=1
MAYNKRNTLLKMIRVQDIVLSEKKKGVSQLFVYEHLIRDTFLISYSTFKHELKHGRKKPQDKQQLTFGF